jgi:hypothetical protein
VAHSDLLQHYPMESANNKNRKIKILKAFTFLSSFFLLITLIIYGLWIYVCYVSNIYDDFSAQVDMYRAFFPEYLRDRYDTTFLGFFCSLFSSTLNIVCIVLSIKLKYERWMIANIILLIPGVILFSLYMGGLM